MVNESVIPAEAVEAAAKALNSDFTNQWEKLPEWIRADIRRETAAALEAAAPHMLAGIVAEAKANNDHIIEGGDGYSAGFHYALHCIAGDDT